MNKQKFLLELSQKLSDLPKEDVDKSLDYYSEMIDDRIEDGLTEAEAVEAVGSPDEIYEQISADTPTTNKESRTEEKVIIEKKGVSALMITLLILGFPLWFPLMIAAFALILTAFILIWTVAIVLYSVVISFGAVAIVGIADFFIFLFIGEGIKAFGMFGIGIAFTGITVLSIMGTNYIVKLIAKLSIFIFKATLRLFKRKKGTKNEN